MVANRTKDSIQFWIGRHVHFIVAYAHQLCRKRETHHTTVEEFLLVNFNEISENNQLASYCLEKKKTRFIVCLMLFGVGCANQKKTKFDRAIFAEIVQ